MSVSKKYIRDRTVLLLLSINAFLVLLGSTVILLKLSTGQGANYIVQYRSNLGISAYKAGSSVDIIMFVVFLVGTFVMNYLLSVKIYGRHRSYALTVLGLGVLLSIIAIIVSNALLILR